jgi:uncharacterized protein (DUF58 family)
MVAFDEKIRFNLPCGSTPAHLDRIFHHLEDLQPGGQTALGETFHQLADRLPRRGLVIIISDLYDEPQDVMRALQHFVYKRHQIMVFHLMDPAERTFPFTQRIALTDMETRQRVSVDPAEIREEYCRRVQEYIDAYRRQCAQRDIEYRLAETDTPYEHLLREYLTRRKALLK